jgi:hypothetical protein
MTPKAPDPQGKAALFSGQARDDGPLVVECSGCTQTTRVGFARLARLAFPIAPTNPLRYYHTWMRCPSCNRRNWVKVRMFS